MNDQDFAYDPRDERAIVKEHNEKLTLLEPSEASKSAAAPPAEQEEDAIGNRSLLHPPLAALPDGLGHDPLDAYLEVCWANYQRALAQHRAVKQRHTNWADTKLLLDSMGIKL